MGSIPSNYAPFMKKGILVLPYIRLMIKKNSKESPTTIFVQKLFIYIFYLSENCGHHDDTVTDSHIQSQVRIGVLVYRSVQNTKSQEHRNECDQNQCHNFPNATQQHLDGSQGM